MVLVPYISCNWVFMMLKMSLVRSEFLQDDMVQESTDPPSGHSLPYVLFTLLICKPVSVFCARVAEMTPLESISRDLGFNGNSLAEGLVLCALPMIIGATCRWRICFWLSTIPSTVLAVAMIFCAESPHWLYKNRMNCCTGVEFQKLLGPANIRSAMAELLKSDRGDENDTVTISELVSGRHSRVVFIGSTLFALQQLSGINAVFYFSSTVFRSAGVSSNLANAFVGIVNLLGSFIALLLMDKLGRKVLLLWSFFGMAISTVVQVIAAGLFASTSGALYLAVGGMLMFVFSFAIGAGPVPGLLLSEIFPSRIRAKAMAFCVQFHGGIMFCVLSSLWAPAGLYQWLGQIYLMDMD
ncbi:probable plastidic glucose transporter 2 isoform X1 [Tanacetum coccineum]|uniref:Probable plastidic glucose transporter 2 isoform X1 n=1 Tax=Tanacetum coccineum TaxID=301880 RepID=A0ABQ4YIE9_9ASTR